MILELAMVASFVQVEAIMPTACDRYGHTEIIFLLWLGSAPIGKGRDATEGDEKLDLSGFKAGIMIDLEPAVTNSP